MSDTLDCGCSEFDVFSQEKIDLLDDLLETPEFLQAEAVFVSYSIGDVTFVRDVGSANAVRGTAEIGLDILRGSGKPYLTEEFVQDDTQF